MSSVGIIKWGDNHLFIFLLVTDTQWSGFQTRKLKTYSQPPASISIEVAEALGQGPAREWYGVVFWLHPCWLVQPRAGIAAGHVPSLLL